MSQSTSRQLARLSKVRPKHILNDYLLTGSHHDQPGKKSVTSTEHLNIGDNHTGRQALLYNLLTPVGSPNVI